MIGEWTASMVAQLNEGWARGDSCQTIANVLGVSKSAVIGKAHRLKLPQRESPIKPTKSAAAAPVVPPVVSLQKAASTPAAGQALSRPIAEPAPTPTPQTVFSQPSPPAGGCKWPLWAHHEAPTHRYCDAARENAAHSYCTVHAAKAFTPHVRRAA